MFRRLNLLALAAAALLLAACEINTNYDLDIAADGSSVFELEVVYNGEAAQLFGSAEAFLDEIEQDTEGDIDGVTVRSASADSSDPDEQRVAVTLDVATPEALDALLASNFDGGASFTPEGGEVYRLMIGPEEDLSDFGELGELGGDEGDDEIPFDLDFIRGSLALNHAGSQVSASGAESEGGDALTWDPFGDDDLVVVMDLSGATPAEDEQDVSEEEPAEEEEPADDESTADVEEDVEEAPVDEEPADEVDETDGSNDQDVVVAADEGDDDEGLSSLLIAAIAGGLLLAIIIAIVVAKLMRRKGGSSDTGTAQVPAHAGAVPPPLAAQVPQAPQPPPAQAPQPPPAQAPQPPPPPPAQAPQPPPAQAPQPPPADAPPPPPPSN